MTAETTVGRSWLPVRRRLYRYMRPDVTVTIPDKFTIARRNRIISAQESDTMAERKHGQMDITQHHNTFEGFVKTCIWVIGISAAVLIFLSIFNS